ncbi:MAG: ATP-grasp fold amidoligase family protein [Ginsengibacter sp.]
MLKNNIFLLWYSFCRHVLVILPDRFFFQLVSFLTHTRLGFKFHPLNFKNPVTFNDKLNYIKGLPLNDTHTILADKVLVRQFIKDRIGENYLVPCLGVYQHAKDIDFENLPQSFILKTNHGSGWNMICRDKNNFDQKKAITLFNRWLGFNAYYLSREKQYKNIRPLIICEELLKFDIYDYKFFCFHGKPKFVQVDIDRFSNHKRAFYDMQWNKLPFSIRYPVSAKEILIPAKLEEMKNVAAMLSKDLKFCRVDLYIHGNKVFFGEVTLIPGGGNEPFLPQEYNKKLGALIDITI